MYGLGKYEVCETWHLINPFFLSQFNAGRVTLSHFVLLMDFTFFSARMSSGAVAENLIPFVIGRYHRWYCSSAKTNEKTVLCTRSF